MASTCVISPPPRNETAKSSNYASRPQFNLFRRQSPPSPPPFTKFSVNTPNSPITAPKSTNKSNTVSSNKKSFCMCAPTSHPGSFRCAYHKRLAEKTKDRATSAAPSTSASATSARLNLRKSAMKNSLVRMGGVEGEIAKRTLNTALMRSSAFLLKPREVFQPKRSRFWMMMMVKNDNGEEKQ